MKEFIAIEINHARALREADAWPIRDLSPFLDKPLRKGRVLSMDREVRKLDNQVLAVPEAGITNSPTGKKPQGFRRGAKRP